MRICGGGEGEGTQSGGQGAEQVHHRVELFEAAGLVDLLAEELIAGVATPMEDERIETRWFPAREVERMIETGKLDDAKTIVGFYRWKKA